MEPSGCPSLALARGAGWSRRICRRRVAGGAKRRACRQVTSSAARPLGCSAAGTMRWASAGERFRLGSSAAEQLAGPPAAPFRHRPAETARPPPPRSAGHGGRRQPTNPEPGQPATAAGRRPAARASSRTNSRTAGPGPRQPNKPAGRPLRWSSGGLPNPTAGLSSRLPRPPLAGPPNRPLAPRLKQPTASLRFWSHTRFSAPYSAAGPVFMRLSSCLT